MIGFFIVASLLVALVLALVGYPILRGRDGAMHDDDPTAELVAVGRAHLAELERKHRFSEIGDTEYQAQRRDIETQLADELQSRNTAPRAMAGHGARWPGVAVLVLIPMLSGLLYLSLGRPQALLPGATRAATASAPKPAKITTMVAGLAERLKRNPNDPEGWTMLGRSYMVMQRYQDAAKAFGHLRALIGDRPGVLVSQATAMAMARGGDLSGEPLSLVRLALDQQPRYPQALWLAATAAYQAKDYATALDYFQRAEPLLEGEALQQVRKTIRELTERGYGKVAATTAPQEQQTETVSQEAQPVALRVTVSLAPDLRDDASRKATVFIFAKALHGPPMPLAVVRKTVAELPVTVTLSDRDAMAPAFKLSGFEQVTVGARVSQSGQATARAGDLEGESKPISMASSGPVAIVIDQVVGKDGE